ncbi:MAG: porin family protein [Legionellaceae bacterium]|nr:porin family protein [Legionellaceae bacterium]
MKKMLLAASLLSCNLVNAATPIDGLYLGAFGGYSYVPDNLNVSRAGLTRSFASYNDGWNTGLRLGYQSNPMRYELEYTYLRANLKHFRINHIRQPNVSGFNDVSLLMANAYMDLPEMVPLISPFLGAGLGYALVRGKFNSANPPEFSRYHAKNNVFAYQATTGLTYNFAENYAINLAYRFVATVRADEFGRSFQAHMANVGVLYRFDEARYK